MTHGQSLEVRAGAMSSCSFLPALETEGALWNVGQLSLPEALHPVPSTKTLILELSLLIFSESWAHLWSRYFSIRIAKSFGTLFWLRNLRIFQIWDVSAMLRSCDNEPVMLPTRYEKHTNPKTTTAIEKTLSTVFCGCTCIEAGVNWVMDQWKDVRYWYETGDASKPCSTTQFVPVVSPSTHHKHAMIWFTISR